MNLRDAELNISPGETGVTLGCDFSEPGKIKPMHEGLETFAYATDIIDSHIRYIAGVRYVFTTHNEGLYCLRPNSPMVLIDAAFTGTFKVEIVNDQYAVFMNSTLCKKWKPGWPSTYTWGLPVHPAVTVAAKTLETKTIDDCEVTTNWAVTGGGTGGAIATDATNYYAGSKSLKITSDAGYTALAVKSSVTLDLTAISSTVAAGAAAYIRFYLYPYALSAIDYLKIKLSCASGGGFTKDFYEMKLTLGQSGSQTTLAYTQGEMQSYIDSPQELFSGLFSSKSSVSSNQPVISPQYDSEGNYVGTVGTYDDQGLDEVDPVLNNANKVMISSKARRVTISNAAWTEVKILLTDFVRHGATAGRNWSNITSIGFDLAAINSQANVSIDQIELCGAGNSWGNYWVAAAYQNEFGNYGAYSAFAGPTEVEGQGLVISGLTPSTDGQVTKRRLCIVGGSMTEFMVTTVDNNTETSYEFNSADDTLTQAEKYFNNRPPVPGKDMVIHDGRVFIVGPTAYLDRMIYSESYYFEAFPYRNYMPVSNGETLNQVAVMGEYLAIRSATKEHIVQLTGENHKTWRRIDGAIEGAASSRLLLILGEGAHVYMSSKGFFISTNSGLKKYYLSKINSIVTNHGSAMGALAGDRAYIAFTDTAGNDRVMRIDYRLGEPVAHYVQNLAVTAIFADRTAEKAYYAYGSSIYEFDAGTDVLPTQLTIPEQHCGASGIKDFVRLQYALDNGPLSMTLKADRAAITGTYTLATASKHGASKNLPKCSGRSLGITLTSTTEDYILYLPIGLENVVIAD